MIWNTLIDSLGNAYKTKLYDEFSSPVIFGKRSKKILERRNGVTADAESASMDGGFDAMLAKSVAERADADASVFQMHLRTPATMQQRAYQSLHRNPFDVDREDLVSQLSNLKFSLLHPDRWKGSAGKIYFFFKHFDFLGSFRLDWLLDWRYLLFFFTHSFIFEQSVF